MWVKRHAGSGCRWIFQGCAIRGQAGNPLRMNLESLEESKFDAANCKHQFPGLTASGLHYLDNAATAQMPDPVFEALRRFEIDARANVHEGLHTRARTATERYHEARRRVARFLNACSEAEVVFTYGAT